MAPLEYQLFYQRRLPHYQPPGVTLFITFRLAGSLPREVIERLEAEKRQKGTEIERMADIQARKQAGYIAQKQLFGKWDAELDAVRYGPTWLYEPGVAGIVCEALQYRDEREYSLEAFCVMPNHVHLVCTPLPSNVGYYPISKILHSMKGYTARMANLLLGREGAFWQHESYDHVVRDGAELSRIVNYVIANPVRAGLVDKWVYCRPT